MMKVCGRPIVNFLVILAGLVIIATAKRDHKYTTIVDEDGHRKLINVDRAPALYTGTFGSCYPDASSQLNVTRFDAGLYSDNATGVFHLEATTTLPPDAVIVHVALFAYGKERFKMTLDPCEDRINSLCPMNSDSPIQAHAMWYLTAQQLADIPAIAYSIPDFDGYVQVKVFANSTQTLISCIQADMTNGNTMLHPGLLGSLLSVVAGLASIASFLTATYGLSVTHIRSHYAHSLSAMLVLEVFQTIFFSGALAVNWPKILPAWWSNFAWSAGIMSTPSMLRNLAEFTGTGRLRFLPSGAQPAMPADAAKISHDIYGRLMRRALEVISPRRVLLNASNPHDYTWGGGKVQPGVPVPGNWAGFPGTLAALQIPAKDVFTISLLWLVVTFMACAFLVALFKWLLELLIWVKALKPACFQHFRLHWIGYIKLVIGRMTFVSCTATMTLCLFEFTVKGEIGPLLMAAFTFCGFLLGTVGLVTWASHYRLRFGRFIIVRGSGDHSRSNSRQSAKIDHHDTDSANYSENKSLNLARVAPWTISLPTIQYRDDDPARESVNRDIIYIKQFGWLSGRYRRTKWWFFSCWLAYHLWRAVIVGGLGANPIGQVYGLLVLDMVAFAMLAVLRPFESQRNMVLVVYLLGVSKIITTVLTAMLLPEVGLTRIAVTAIGVVIIAVQCLLLIGTTMLVLSGCVSTWMSMSRNKEMFPAQLNSLRIRYYGHIEAATSDLPQSRHKGVTGYNHPSPPQSRQKPVQSSFEVRSVRKIHGVGFSPVEPLVSNKCSPARSVSSSGDSSKSLYKFHARDSVTAHSWAGCEPIVPTDFDSLCDSSLSYGRLPTRTPAVASSKIARLPPPPTLRMPFINEVLPSRPAAAHTARQATQLTSSNDGKGDTIGFGSAIIELPRPRHVTLPHRSLPPRASTNSSTPNILKRSQDELQPLQPSHRQLGKQYVAPPPSLETTLSALSGKNNRQPLGQSSKNYNKSYVKSKGILPGPQLQLPSLGEDTEAWEGVVEEIFEKLRV